ncbi:psbP domain-containing protein 2, chloroplastic [Mangifera indica]|uniref:psbP domain-containing protein 2, chloroplastic n=1 Tax=Mangifera indica TaxID=29780 RepID=UPI001CFC2FCE|nr:psbP domain-containing protein 2, chloroplastic [Mangifera indica]
MDSQICSALSTHHNSAFVHNPITKFSSSTKPPFSPRNFKTETLQVSLCLCKREINLSLVALLLNGFYAKVSKAEEMELERYTDSTEGFTFLRPSSWIKVDKAGATVLFQEANKGSNNVGVVVNPVRLSSLGEFGTPQFVAEKLIQAEKRKESTIEAELIEVAERSSQKGLQVYEFEYKVDSSRGGLKRIFSAAFVASRKLYLLNINYSNKQESPLDNYTRMKLEEVLHSFDAAPIA